MSATNPTQACSTLAFAQPSIKSKHNIGCSVTVFSREIALQHDPKARSIAIMQ